LDNIHVSIIVCCYNSESRIIPTLEHIAKQKIENLQLEVILVDNNSNDNTAKVAIEVWSKLGNPFSLSILKEPTPGLSYARKKGVSSANGEIIIFCDDDNWLDENYVITAFKTMQNNLSIGVLAGQSKVTADIEIPNWFFTYYGNYACGVLSLHSGDVSNRLWVWGAGLVLRRKQMLMLYSKYSHTTKGRTKDSMESGDDVEICYWHILERKLLWYDDRLKLQHYMPSNRLTIESAEKQFKAQDISAFKMKGLTQLTSAYYKYCLGELSTKSILHNILRLRFRATLNGLHYYIKFKMQDL
jgi:glycosyltransferase involved in cell wall biosynthesis